MRVGASRGQQAEEAALRHAAGRCADGGVALGPVDRQPQRAPQVLEGLLVLGDQAVAQLDEVGTRDGDRVLLGLGGRRERRVVAAGTGRSAPRSGSGRGARWAGRCRPSPWGRRPPRPASAGSGRRCRCGCRRTRDRCASEPDTVGGGVSMAKTRALGARAVEAVGPRLVPARRPLGLEAVERGSLGHGRGPRGLERRWAQGVRRGRRPWSRLPYLSAAAPRHRHRHDRARSSPGSPGRVAMYVCGPTVYDVPASRPRPLRAGLRRPAPLPRVRGPRRPLRLEHHRHRRQDHRPGRRPRGRTEGRGGRRVRRGVVGGHGRPRRLAPDRHAPRHRLRRQHGDAGGRPRRPGRGLRDRRRRLPVGRPGRRLRPAGPPAPRTRCAPGPGSSPARRSARRSTSCCGRRPSRASRPGPRRGAPGRPGWHTECVVMSLDLLGDGFDLHGGGIDLAFPHHENERAQAVAAGRTFARHWVHNGCVMIGGEKMSKSLGNFTSLTDLLAPHRRPRLPAAASCAAHYRSPDRGDPGDRRPRPRRAWRASTPWRAASRLDRADRPAADRRRGGGRSAPTPTPWPPSGRAWTTTSTPRPPWPGSSSWPVRPTWPPTPATDAGHRLAATVVVLCAALGPGPRRRAGELDGPPPRWWPSATPPGRPATGPGPTPSGTSSAGAGWVVEDGPRAPGSTVDLVRGAGRAPPGNPSWRRQRCYLLGPRWPRSTPGRRRRAGVRARRGGRQHSRGESHRGVGNGQVVQRGEGVRLHLPDRTVSDVFVHHSAIQMNGYRRSKRGRRSSSSSGGPEGSAGRRRAAQRPPDLPLSGPRRARPPVTTRSRGRSGDGLRDAVR